MCVLCKVAGVAQGPESALSWWQWCLNELTPSEGEDLAVPAGKTCDYICAGTETDLF